ncbi:radical SAM protein [Desulfovibrio oxyclinae]|uniref:radical SAM protein n=1 Tax=Desulfovibrio oxyclinae TaxID=63560 RepID=UPI00035C57CD|nr:radical SAM protein [Desulfovibrio oxyclinae]
MGYKYVFGPVMSGRLGRSLGLDLLGGRICSMDCVYCEVGATRQLTIARAPYIPAEDILDELERWKDEGHEPPEMITLGGLGEPTLNTELPYVIEESRKLFPGVPVAVLTNSTLLPDPTVRAELAQADVVLPSLDSLVQDEFRSVNRPVPGVEAETVGQGLEQFRKEFRGKIFLEILLVRGVNDSDRNLDLLADFCRRNAFDRVDVVTLSRPGTERSALAADPETVVRWREALEAGEVPATEREVVRQDALRDEQIIEMILSSLDRRPQTAAQLSQALGVGENRMENLCIELERRGELVARRDPDGTFYHGAGREMRD